MLRPDQVKTYCPVVKYAFDEGHAICEDGGGYLFRVYTGDHVFEGVPDDWDGEPILTIGDTAIDVRQIRAIKILEIHP